MSTASKVCDKLASTHIYNSKTLAVNRKFYKFSTYTNILNNNLIEVRVSKENMKLFIFGALLFVVNSLKISAEHDTVCLPSCTEGKTCLGGGLIGFCI